MTADAPFDPVAILGALERHRVDYILIGGLAQVLRGADVVTRDVDICPSFGRGNTDRLDRALGELESELPHEALGVSEEVLAADPVVRVATAAGPVGIVGSPAGVPNGYVDLRRAATREDLGGVRPLVASTGDLAAMAAALHRPADLQRLAMLRRVVELEARPEQVIQREPQPVRSPARSARRTGRRITP